MTSSADLDSQEEKFLIDFLYADRPRLATLSAQLFNDGHLISSKTQAVKSAESGYKVGGSLKILSGDTSSLEKVQESIERQFDSTWSVPLDVLRELNAQGYLDASIEHATLGQVVLISGQVQILDLRMIQMLWKPILQIEKKKVYSNSTKSQRAALVKSAEENLDIAGIIELLPHMLELRVYSENSISCGTMNPDGLTINPADLAFKHGAYMPGDWRILALIDARPGIMEQDLVSAMIRGANPVEIGLLPMYNGLRQMLGRGESEFGITPLAIYREIAAG